METDPTKMFLEELQRDAAEILDRKLSEYKQAVADIRRAVSIRLLAAADDDDMAAPEAFVLGQITGILARLPEDVFA